MIEERRRKDEEVGVRSMMQGAPRAIATGGCAPAWALRAAVFVSSFCQHGCRNVFGVLYLVLCGVVLRANPMRVYFNKTSSGF